jgi:hypothetical protein
MSEGAPKTPHSSPETVRDLREKEAERLRDALAQVMKGDPKAARKKLEELLRPASEQDKK